VREGAPGFKARSQSSLAVSRDGTDWVLLNASPDIRQQISATPALAPCAEDGLRSSPIKAVVLTNGDVDHMAGLINLREAQPFTIYATRRVLDVIAANSVFRILASDVVAREPLALDVPSRLYGSGIDLGLDFEAFDVPGKIALYLEDESAGPNFGTGTGDTIGLRISDPATGKAFAYIPGCAEIDGNVRKRLQGASHVFFDGTLYDDEEMIRAGLMNKSGPRMGHISMNGSGGSIAKFEDLGVGRKIYVHINNSNPVLDEYSPERRAVEAAGWEVGYDGMEVRI
jgi:pyrroloquinoline quinone biosynthesis protein B